MDTDVLTKAAVEHLGVLRTRITQACGIALVLLISGLAYKGEVTLLGLTVQRHAVAFTASFVFLFLQLSIMDKTFRFGQLVRMIPDSDLPDAYKALGLHVWSANPLAMVGTSWAAMASAAKWLGILVVAHAVMNVWPWAYGRRSVGIALPIRDALPFLSVLTIVSLARTRKAAVRRISISEPSFGALLHKQNRYVTAWFVLSLIVSLALFVWVVVFEGQIR